ncbi:hypothetical protein Poli38472_011104 [Pythium oligandrum]|uniref:CST complex subunit CTC1 n=1 Tax=Pythium oligandrum TaxID=41045 RepID=A0A8K1FNM5_PYTOL|nr:hypothetical protein Poli38472_011104 [Pythium oligandrum]|eukprot:TMW67484.1 hypothetical protein Poli38472_011104 [Pythium oligandrum]
MILITNLKKVFSQECEVFLLQGSFHLSGREDKTLSTTQLFLWNESSIQQPFFDGANRDKEDNGYMTGTVVKFEGYVEEVVWDECLVIRGELRAIVVFFHYPTLDIFRYLRAGSRVRIQEAHIIRHASSAHSTVMLGVCTRSFVAISSHVSESVSPSLPLKRQNLRRSLKKWSIFGDFYQQPLCESIRWLELFQVITRQFFFGSDVDDKTSTDSLAYRCVRRRDAVCRVVGLSAPNVNQKTSPSVTLARRFLTSHSCNPQDCPSITSKITAELGCFKTVSDTQKKISEAVHKMLHHTKDGLQWPLRMSSDDLAITPIVVCLTGNIDSLDLEVCDRTGRMPCHVVGDVTPVVGTGGCTLYMLKKLDVVVECVDSPVEYDDVETPNFVISVSVASTDLQSIPLCSGAEHWVTPEDKPVEKWDLMVFVTKVDAVDRGKRHTRKQERRIHGVALRINDASDCATMDHTNAFRVELVMDSEVEHWFVRKHQWYYLPKVRMAEIFTVVEENRAQPTSDDSTEVTCVKWLRLLSREAPTVDHVNAEAFAEACETLWTAATQSKEHSSMSMLTLNRQNVFVPIMAPQLIETNAGQPKISSYDNHIMALTQRVVLSAGSPEIYRVRDLFQHSPWVDEDETNDLHQVRLIRLIGVIQEKTLVPNRHTTYQTRVTPGSKRQSLSDQPSPPSSQLTCRLKIRDLGSLEVIAIRLSANMLSHYGGLQPGVVIDLTNAQINIARGTFKSYIQWGHRTRLRIVPDMSPTEESSIYGQMPTTRLMSLYSSSALFDRTIRRFVVRVVHVSYVVLKRRCGGCRKPLDLMKQRRMWTHGEATDGQSSSCQWKHFQQMSPLFNRRTYVSASMRCIIDDGSAQSELFLENAVVWEMFRCGKGQQRRFEDVLSQHVSALSFYATRSAADTLFTTTTARETEYYHNEWRAFVQDAFTASRSLVVFAQRFYSPPKTSRQTSVLTFGKDLRVTIPAAPLAQLEALRVDDVHVRNELQRRLASIRIRPS